MRALLLIAATIAAISSPAAAMTVSGGSLSHSGATDYAASLGQLLKFDGTKGTLTGVSFTVGYGFASTITVSATTDSKGSAFTESGIRFSSSDAAIQAVLNGVVNRTVALVGSMELDPAAYDLNGTRSIFSVGPSYQASATYNSNAAAGDTFNLTSSMFSAFIAGPGSTAFDVSAATLTGLTTSSTGGNASAVQQTTATQSASVLYTYAPSIHVEVTEPASLALLGTGLLGVGLIRRRQDRDGLAFVARRGRSPG